MKKPHSIRHDVIETILDEHLGFMSGKTIKRGEREQRRYFRVDYQCSTVGDIPESPGSKPQVLPFEHLKDENIIEFKSCHQVLNEKIFRNYVARALVVETESPVDHQGKVSLTIITTRKPISLIACGKYAIEQINDWKYKSRCFMDLEVFIIVIKGMRDKKAGEALAYLQVLEEGCWNDVLGQKLENSEELKKFMGQINREEFMILADQFRQEGKIEGKIEGKMEGRKEELLRVLSWTSPKLCEKYEAELRSAKTEEELEKLEEIIKKEHETEKQQS